MKKGQVALFVIVGLVIVIVIGIFFGYKLLYTKEKLKVQEERLASVPNQFLPVEGVIESCFEDTAERAVKHVALHGGYFNPKPSTTVVMDSEEEYEFPHILEDDDEDGFSEDDPIVDLFGSNKLEVGYWYYKGEKRVPPIAFVESQISLAATNFASFCLVDLLDFGDYTFINSNETKLVVTTNINDGVDFIFNYPLKVEYKGMVYQIKNKALSIDSKILNVYNTGIKIVDKISEKPDMIPLTYLAQLNYTVNLYPNEDDVVYMVSDNETKLYFANKIV